MKLPRQPLWLGTKQAPGGLEGGGQGTEMRMIQVSGP